ELGVEGHGGGADLVARRREAAAAGAVADEVVALAGEGAEHVLVVGADVLGDDGVGDRQRRTVAGEDAAANAGAIATHGRTGEGHGGGVGDAAAEAAGRRIAADGGVRQGRRAADVADAAAGVAADGGAGDGQRAAVILDAPAEAGVGGVAADGGVGDGRHAQV